jgi:arginine/ornithine N-succinyltransferase beta subunit
MKLFPEHRDVLNLLANNERGCTEALLMAHGFKHQVLVDLIRAGFARADIEAVRAGSRKMDVVRVTITDAGRRAVAN